MNAAITQLALVLGLGTLAVLLIRGMSLMTALFRGGIVLIAVLLLFVIAGNILRVSLPLRRVPKRKAPEQPVPEIEEEGT